MRARKLLFSCLLAAACAVPAAAAWADDSAGSGDLVAGSIATNSSAVVDVTDKAYGANGRDTKDDSAAINAALATAKGATSTVTVRIPAGTYYLDNGLRILSNTTLKLDDGAVLVARLGDGAMIEGRHFKSDGTVCAGESTCAHGGYSQIHDITIDGGTWKRNASSGNLTTVIMLRHGTNITVKNAVLTGSTDHYVNVSGCNHVTVENVTMKDAVKYTGKAAGFWGDFAVGDPQRYRSVEAVHLDTMSKDGEPNGYPVDNTPVKDATVKNCTFTNVLAGVGTHHVITGVYGKNITVTGNTFKNLMGTAVNAYSFDGLTVTGNIIQNAGIGLASFGSKNITFTNNTVKGATEYGVNIGSGSTVGILIDRNKVLDSKQSAIRLFDRANATIKGNTITTASHYGLFVEGATAKLLNNAISATAKTGIQISAKSSVEASSNSVSGAKENGIYVGGSSTAILSSNKVSSPSVAGVRVAESSKATLSKNTVTNAGTDGVSVGGSSDVSLDANTVSDAARYNVFAHEGSKAKVTSNTVKNAGSKSIVLENVADGAVIDGNTVDGSEGRGITVMSSKNVSIRKNTVTNCKGNGIHVEGSDSAPTSASIEGNISTNSVTGDNLWDIRLGKGCVSSTIKDNTVGVRGWSADKTSGCTASGNKEQSSSSAASSTTSSAKWQRLYGADALKTMSAIVNAGWSAGSADCAIVATNDGYWDALTASSLAGVNGAPVLLTDKNSLSPETAAQITRLGAKKVYIVGGTAAVKSKVETQLKALPGVTVKRLAGSTADGTAQEIAAESYATQASDTVVIATINGYYDALSIAPYAYSKGTPVLLTDSSLTLSASSLSFVKSHGFKNAVIVGGTAAVSSKVDSQLVSAGISKSNIKRLAGNNAWETSYKIADWEVSAQGMTANNMGVADGCGYWDALTGAPLCGKNGAVLVLVPHNDGVFGYDPYCIDHFVKPHASDIKTSYVFGGEAVVPASTMKALQAATR